MPFLDFWKKRARTLKVQTYALYYAYRDPRTPLPARLFVAAIVAYAFSPIDLIPDFIPVLGYLDDLIIIPAGVWLALKMIPPEVMAESRVKAEEVLATGKPVFRFMAVVIIALWIVVIAAVGLAVFHAIEKGSPILPGSP
jgi:uncharacterized membrane protein YkvA (DUF1232 family)